MDIQDKALSKALNALNALKVSYKVICKDGTEYGDLVVVTKKAHTRRHGIFLATGYQQKIDALGIGEVAVFLPPEGTTAKEMQKPVSARAGKVFGNGNFMSTISNGQVQVMRIA